MLGVLVLIGISAYLTDHWLAYVLVGLLSGFELLISAYNPLVKVALSFWLWLSGKNPNEYTFISAYSWGPGEHMWWSEQSWLSEGQRLTISLKAKS